MLCIQDEINCCKCALRKNLQLNPWDKFFGNFNVNKDIHSCISEVNFFGQKQQEPVPSAFNLLIISVVPSICLLDLTLSNKNARVTQCRYIQEQILTHGNY